jgi:ergothioneine biosynthesis protein EgtB
MAVFDTAAARAAVTKPPARACLRLAAPERRIQLHRSDEHKPGRAAARSLEGTMPPDLATASAPPSLAGRFDAVRECTEQLCAALTDEDQCVQSMPDASPAKWHRAHTTWFFEQFLLLPHCPGYAAFDRDFSYLFNSYYEAVGDRHPRPQRGLLTRPGAARVGEYRRHVDTAMHAWLREGLPDELAPLLTLGLHHEQQHQELLVTDTTHAFAQNPLLPAMLPGWTEAEADPGPTPWIERSGGIAGIGVSGGGFCFDNETPRHQTLLPPHALARRLVRNSDFHDFMQDGGYRTAALWMAEGWDQARQHGWCAPLYWRQGRTGWMQFGPGGLAPLKPAAPVRHISWYEADAFARWAGARLPTEAELEAGSAALDDFAGHVWQWSSSAYGPYPGFCVAPGAVGEYNGKFMINQMVLRGASLATPPHHARPSYRNFFHPDRRWQFSGLRLARDS